MSHFEYKAQLTDASEIVNKCFYSKTSAYEPTDNLNLAKMIDNLSQSSDQEENLLKILNFKKEQEQVLKTHYLNETHRKTDTSL